MGNNLKQKNNIQEMQKFSSLPYDNADKISFNENNCYINSVTLNNVFNQLVENDLYVNNHLNIKSGTQIGPKSGDEESIRNGVDGYKYWDDNDGQVSIYRKVNKTYQDSLTEVAGSATLISRVNDDILIANIGGLAYSGSTSNLDSQFRFDTEIKYKDASGNLHQMDIKCKCETDTQRVFACRIVDTGKYGLFFVKKSDEDENYYFTIITETEGIAKSVDSRDQCSQIVYCTDEGVWLLTLDSGTVQVHDKIFTTVIDAESKPQLVHFLDKTLANYTESNSVLVILDNGDMWISEEGATSKNARSTIQQNVPSDIIKIYSSEYLNDRLFLSTPKGIYYFDGDEIKQFRSCDIRGKFTSTSSGLVYSCTSGDGSSIRRMSYGSDGQYKDQEIIHENLTDIATVYLLDGAYVYVAKNGIYANINGDRQEIFTTDLDVVDSLFYPSSNTGVLFLLIGDGENTKLVRISFEKQKKKDTRVPGSTDVKYTFRGNFVNSYMIQQNQYVVSYDGTDSSVINATTGEQLYFLHEEKLLGMFECNRNAWFVTDMHSYKCSSRQVANKATLQMVSRGLALPGVVNCGYQITSNSSDFSYCVLNVYDGNSGDTHLSLVRIYKDSYIELRNSIRVGDSPGVYCENNRCFALNEDRTIGTYQLNATLRCISSDLQNITVSDTNMDEILQNTSRLVEIGFNTGTADEIDWMEAKEYLVTRSGDVQVISCRTEDGEVTSRGIQTVASGIRDIKYSVGRSNSVLTVSKSNSFSVYCRPTSYLYNFQEEIYKDPSKVLSNSLLSAQFENLDDVTYLSSSVGTFIDTENQMRYDPGSKSFIYTVDTLSGDISSCFSLVYSGDDKVYLDVISVITHLTCTPSDFSKYNVRALVYESQETVRDSRIIGNCPIDKIVSNGETLYAASGNTVSAFNAIDVLTATDIGDLEYSSRTVNGDVNYIDVDWENSLLVVATDSTLYKFNTHIGIGGTAYYQNEYRGFEIDKFIDLQRYADDYDSVQQVLFGENLVDGIVMSNGQVYVDDDFILGETSKERFSDKTADRFEMQQGLVTMFSNDSNELTIYDTTSKSDIETAVDVITCNYNIGNIYVYNYSKPGNLEYVISADDGEWHACRTVNYDVSDTIDLDILDSLDVERILFAEKGTYNNPFIVTPTDLRTIRYTKLGYFPYTTESFDVDGNGTNLVRRENDYNSFYIIAAGGGQKDRYVYDGSTKAIHFVDTNSQIVFSDNLDNIYEQCQIRVNLDGGNSRVTFGNDLNLLQMSHGDVLFKTFAGGAQVVAMIRKGNDYHIIHLSGSRVCDLIIQGVSTGTYLNDTGHSIGQSPSGIITVENNDTLIVTGRKIYKYTFDRDVDEPYIYGYLMLTSDSEYGGICQISESGSSTFLIGDGTDVLSSSDVNQWSSLFHVESGHDIADMCPVDSRHIFVVAPESSTQNHIFYTKYLYECVNDTKPFTYEDAYSLYMENVDDINDSIEDAVATHEDREHGEDNQVTEVNKYTTTDFEICGFTQTGSAPGDITNDYIEDVKFGSADDTIAVTATNTANGTTTKTIQCDYIMKCWNSGIVDLYIHLPTTYTYYVPHIPYAGNCKVQSDTYVTVNGKKITNSISDNYTTIAVKLMSTFFNLGNITENTINGMSLPLNINRDKSGDAAELEAEASNLFHSMIQPSLACGVDLTDLQDEFFTLNYYCFGSDEQAIHLSYYDNKKVFNKKYKEVIYHSRYTDETNMDRTVKQRFLEGEPSKSLLDCPFENNTAFFIGWTSIRTDYANREAKWTGVSLSYDDIQGKKIDLYAVWNTYEFSDDDTTIIMNARANVVYNIRSMTIDPSVTIDGNLNNSIIVDFDYSS